MKETTENEVKELCDSNLVEDGQSSLPRATTTSAPNNTTPPNTLDKTIVTNTSTTTNNINNNNNNIINNTGGTVASSVSREIPTSSNSNNNMVLIMTEEEEVLETRLQNIKAQVTKIEAEIIAIKKEKGWYNTNKTSYTTVDESLLNVWNKIIEKENFNGGVFGAPSSLLPVSRQTGRVKTRGVKRERHLPSSSHKKFYGGGGTSGGGSGTGSKSVRTTKVQVSVKERRVEAIWQQCMTILNTVKKHKYAWPFLEPVDPVSLNLPDYLEIIDRPMDLGKVFYIITFLY